MLMNMQMWYTLTRFADTVVSSSSDMSKLKQNNRIEHSKKWLSFPK